MVRGATYVSHVVPCAGHVLCRCAPFMDTPAAGKDVVPEVWSELGTQTAGAKAKHSMTCTRSDENAYLCDAT